MTTFGRLALAGLVRTPLRTLIRVVVLAAAVALLGAMMLFIGHSLRTMTASATRSVPLDWQGPVASYRAAVRTTAGVARQPDVLQASAVATAPFAASEHQAAVGTIRSGAGSILAVPPGYLRHIQTFRFLRGTAGARARSCSTSSSRRRSRPSRGHGHADRRTRGTTPALPRLRRRSRHGRRRALPAAQPAARAGPAQPPANIAILPLETFARRIAPALAGAGTSAVPGAQAGVQWQVQAQVDPAALTGSPSHALTRANQIRNRVERSLPGQVQFVDNLSDSLTSAAGDALYAETLFIMLAVPGALIALGLAYLAALGTVERDRRELALLRARGASRRDLLVLAAIESALIGVVAGLLGTGAGLAAVHLVGGGLGLGLGRVLVTLGVCIAVASLGAAAARIGGSLAVFRSSVAEGRRSVRRRARPLWQRLYLDLVALGLSGLIYWLTARTGFSAVVNPDSNPTLSLSVYMFFAPALLWLGATLLLVRLRGRVLAWFAARIAGGRATSWPTFLLASAGRRGPAINRGPARRRAPARLRRQPRRLHRHLRPAGARRRAAHARRGRGRDRAARRHGGKGSPGENRPAARRGGTTAVDHSYAYVGPDLQDTFGIDAATLHARRPRCATPTSSARARGRCSRACARPPTASSSPRRRSATTRSGSAIS